MKMLKAKPSETEAPALPIEETPLPEPQVEVSLEEGVPAPAVQEAEKPDLTAQLEALPKEGRDALLENLVPDFPGRLKRAEQSGRHRAYARWQAEQHRRSQANQTTQDTLRNLAVNLLESLPLPPLPPSSNRP